MKSRTPLNPLKSFAANIMYETIKILYRDMKAIRIFASLLIPTLVIDLYVRLLLSFTIRKNVNHDAFYVSRNTFNNTSPKHHLLACPNKYLPTMTLLESAIEDNLDA